MLTPLSASQIKAYDDGEGGGCPTAWAGTYLGKMPRSESGGTNAGTKVHARLEAYLRDGTGIASGETYTYDGKTYHIGKAALAIAKHLPAAGSVPADHVERPFLITVHHAGKAYAFRGAIDLYRPPPFTPADIYDHKSSRGLGYVPTVKKLTRDIQVAMYAIVYFSDMDGTDTYTIGQGDPDHVVRCQWTYGSTDGSGGRPVRFSVTRAQAEAVFLEKILPVADKIYQAYLAAAPWATHEKNFSACSAYGGCARLKDRSCITNATKRGLAMLTKEQLMAKIEARKAGNAPTAVTPEPAPAPVAGAAGEAPAMSRLERIRRDAQRINRPDVAAGSVAQPDGPEAIEMLPSGSALRAEPKNVVEMPTEASAGLSQPISVPPTEPEAASIIPVAKRRGRPPKTVITPVELKVTVLHDTDLLPGPSDAPVDPTTQPGYTSCLMIDADRATSVADFSATPPGYVLYVDCRPVRAAVTYAHDLLAKAGATVREDAGVPDVGLIDFGKGYPGLAAQLRQDLLDTPVTGAIVTSSYTPEGRATLQVLMEGASEIVLGR